VKVKIKKIRGVPFKLYEVKPEQEAQRLKDQLVKTGRFIVMVIKARASDAPAVPSGSYSVWVADRDDPAPNTKRGKRGR
jgi:hypothetical protein